ncbi:MAG: hypothetical protein IJF84_08650 [Thermoguttaceae bacterium]|nr:hypothetical protein [Thermoguttaceae bacterium]
MNRLSLILGAVVLLFIGCLLGMGLDYYYIRPDNQVERQQLQELKQKYNEELIVLKKNQILSEEELGRIKADQLKIEEYKEKLHNMEMSYANPSYPIAFALFIFFILSALLILVVYSKNQTTNENLIELRNETEDKLRIRTKAAPKPTVQLVQLGSSLDNVSSTPQLENNAANQTPTLQIESDVQDASSDSQTEDDVQQDEYDGASD